MLLLCEFIQLQTENLFTLKDLFFNCIYKILLGMK